MKKYLILGITAVLLLTIPHTPSAQQSGLNLRLVINPVVAFAPTVLTTTFYFNQPVLGEICIQAQAVSEDAEIFYRESCEGLNGSARQIRWRWNWVGEYLMRGTYRGGTERIITPTQRIIIKPPIGR